MGREHKSKNENPVLLFKQQEIMQNDETDELSKEDFILTMLRRDMLN